MSVTDNFAESTESQLVDRLNPIAVSLGYNLPVITPKGERITIDLKEAMLALGIVTAVSFAPMVIALATLVGIPLAAFSLSTLSSLSSLSSLFSGISDLSSLFTVTNKNSSHKQSISIKSGNQFFSYKYESFSIETSSSSSTWSKILEQIGKENFEKATEASKEKLEKVVEINETALQLADELAQKYKVHVAIVKTDSEYYSDELIQKCAEQKVYFISQESKESALATAKTTEYLLKHTRFKYKGPMEIANAKRIDQANEKTLELQKKIEAIKEELKQYKNDSEPSLNRVATILTEKGIESPNGGTKWFAQTVKRVLEKSIESRMK